MADGTAGTWRARFGEIDRRLDAAPAGEERTRLKGEIVSLFKAVEAEIADLTALKDEIRTLVDKWKQLAASEGSAAGRARRSHRRVDVHREGLEPPLARRP
jgi:hypothetical protein